MASYRGHLMFSTTLGVGYGALGFYQWHYDWGPVGLGFGFTMLGGLIPDLDSDSGVPIRELFGLAAFLTAIRTYPHFAERGLSAEQALVALAVVYVFVRYGVAAIFKHLTVHRGMFHSFPAMAIAGLIVYLAYPGRDLNLHRYLAAGTMLGFLSHLVLDAIYNVDFMGSVMGKSKAAGSALKFFSTSLLANITTYAVLAGLGYVAWLH